MSNIISNTIKTPKTSDISNIKDYNLLDQKARVTALNHTKSYIVQAPAGSGKTELLSQRVLKLLNYVEKPEEILALTFTRKAASEMRTRIIGNLIEARDYFIKAASTIKNTDINNLLNYIDNDNNLINHKKTTYKLAIKVLYRNKELNWNLLENPHRLNITTIDSLCVSFIKQMPVLSKSSGNINIQENPDLYYKQAIYEVFKLINTNNFEKNNIWVEDFVLLLEHFSGSYSKLNNFLYNMLGKREQWLPYIASINNNPNAEDIHNLINQSWQELANDLINNIKSNFASDIIVELDGLLLSAEDNIRIDYKDSLDKLNSTQLAILNHSNNNITYWQAISCLLFTNVSSGLSGLALRKSIDKRLGFPAKEAKKKILLDILKDINKYENIDLLLKDFALLKNLPSFDYSSKNWKLLKTLANILILLEAELRIIFKNNKVVDFQAVNQYALDALNLEETDLSLWFDYNIQHILVDEVQDTSYTQYNLLQKLTINWDMQDGKTLFLVGDPMQSIYKFRQAEVGIFLNIINNGINNIKLEFLELRKNFRSVDSIVEWVNSNFIKLLPQKSDLLFGAVKYCNSISTINNQDNNLDKFIKNNNINKYNKLYLFNNIKSEHDYIANQIKEVISYNNQINNNNKISIAILIRTRTRISDLILSLKQKNIIVNSIEIENLSDRMVIKDLLALTRAILDFTDTVAWYSILRAPWCGLTLDELYYLNSIDFINSDILKNNNIIYQKLLYLHHNQSKYNNNDKNNTECKILTKTQNLILILNYVYNNLLKNDLHKLIEQAWDALGGNIIYSNKQEQEDRNQYLDLIFNLEESNYIISTDSLIEEVNKLYSNSQSQQEKSNNNLNYDLNIMTIHKSKGLQFDYVFMPYLDQGSKSTEHQLLAWQQYRNINFSGLLLAPYYFKEDKHNQDKFYNSIRYIEKQKEDYELLRLFYVAVTRSKLGFMLTASCDAKDPSLELSIDNLKLNSNNILSKYLNIATPEDIIFISAPKIECEYKYDVKVDSNNKQLIRIDHDKYKINKLLFKSTEANDNPVFYIVENNINNQILGITIHKILYNFTLNLLDKNTVLDQNNKVVEKYKNIWRNMLLQNGVSLDQINNNLNLLLLAIEHILTDKIGRWILADYNISYAEKEFVYFDHKCNKVKKSIIDRIFIDNNIIWIIDYKISDFYEPNILCEYKQQLSNYKYICKKFFNKIISEKSYIIKTGLYNPIKKVWLEVSL